MSYINGYRLEYIEESKGNLWADYEKVVTVFDEDNEIVLSSRGKEKEEFLNYLGFLVDTDVLETAKELLENGRTKEDDTRDFIELCEESDYLW